MNFDTDFEETLVAFTKANVQFMIVGGVAVNFYGFDRTTSDLDIWVNATDDNKKHIYKALLSLGYSNEDCLFLLNISFKTPQCIKLGDEPHTMDIMTHMVGITYSEAEKLKVEFEIVNGIAIYFIHYTHLVLNKMIAGRPKDKLDVEELQKIIQLKKD